MNFVKNKNKARMSPNVLNALMFIKSNGPPFYAINVEAFTQFYLATPGNRLCNPAAGSTSRRSSIEMISSSTASETYSKIFVQ